MRLPWSTKRMLSLPDASGWQWIEDSQQRTTNSLREGNMIASHSLGYSSTRTPAPTHAYALAGSGLTAVLSSPCTATTAAARTRGTTPHFLHMSAIPAPALGVSISTSLTACPVLQPGRLSVFRSAEPLSESVDADVCSGSTSNRDWRCSSGEDGEARTTAGGR